MTDQKRLGAMDTLWVAYRQNINSVQLVGVFWARKAAEQHVEVLLGTKPTWDTSKISAGVLTTRTNAPPRWEYVVESAILDEPKVGQKRALDDAGEPEQA